MSDRQTEQTKNFWDRVAPDWHIQVGDQGDRNRFLNSDPILWSFAGDVAGHAVLDAGCGTGYLTRQLAARGAMVTGVDFSERMIEIARSRSPEIPFFVDSCSELRTLAGAQFDLLVSNYVLMDLPDLDGAMRAFHRVLRPGGRAVVVFSHPCFPQGCAASTGKGDAMTYSWKSSYFEPAKRVDPPWGHFKSEFIWFHRPLSDYWKAFLAAGFAVTGFEEPHLTEDRYHLAADARELKNCRSRPYSVVFQLSK